MKLDVKNHISELIDKNDSCALKEAILAHLKKAEITVLDILNHIDLGTFSGKRIPVDVINSIAFAICNGSNGIQENKEDALKLFKFAADHGHPASAYSTAVCYLKYPASEAHFQSALKYAKLAKSLAFEHADYLLGSVYLSYNKCSEAIYAFSQVATTSKKYADALSGITIARGQINPAYRDLYFTPAFAMHLGAKNPEKVCDITHDSTRNGLTLHQRQALAERVSDSIFDGGTSPQNSLRFRTPTHSTNITALSNHYILGSLKRYNLVVASIGLVVTDKPHKPYKNGGNHKRRFVTLPIRVTDTNGNAFTTFRGNTTFTTSPVNRTHSENGLFAYLENQDHLNKIVDDFITKYHIAPGYKIYSVVLDLHSTLDMCTECWKDAKNFLTQFRVKLLNTFASRGFVLPKIKQSAPTQASSAMPADRNFRVILNFSSEVDYYTTTNPGIRHEKQPEIDFELAKQQALGATPSTSIDLRTFGTASFFHSTSGSHGMWLNSDRRPHAQAPESTHYEKWTAFITETGTFCPGSKNAICQDANAALADADATPQNGLTTTTS
jgi:hypothetical protein